MFTTHEALRQAGRGLPSAETLVQTACTDSEEFLRSVVVAVFNDGLDRAQELLLVYGLHLAPLDVYRWIERRHEAKVADLQFRIYNLEQELEEERNPPDPNDYDYPEEGDSGWGEPDSQG